MTGSMYAAVSGLKAHMSALNVIGNNVANVNTLGYKTTRYTFNEALYTTQISGSDGTNTAGGRNPAQVGFGASIGTIDLDMSTKNYTPTGHNLDTMIDGDGFFMVGDKTTATGETAVSTGDMTTLKGMNLTRLGNFEIDPNGYLVDGNGSVVWGYLERTATADEIAVANGAAPTAAVAGIAAGTAPTEAQQAEMRAKLHNLVEVSSTDPTTGVTTTTITSATKTVGEALSAIRLPMLATGYDANGNVVGTTVAWPTYVSAGTVTDNSTTPPTVATTPPEINDRNSSAATAVPTGSTATVYEDSVSIAGATRYSFDRVESDTTSIDSKSGALSIMTSDGKLYTVGFLSIAKVTNPNGVTHVDGRYYQALDGAGEIRATAMADIDGAESSGDTKIITGGLESSGTDLATEITNMITVQRGYQANTRIITVTDSMLEELVNMKR